MRLSLCNEVIREFPFERQCTLAAELGYAGLEIAPFTLGDDAYRMPAARRAELRSALKNAGVVASGLHWLLVAPAGLSITSPDIGVRTQTIDVMRRLIALCAELGGEYLVHGSPAQRRISGAAEAAKRGEDAWSAIADDAARAGVVYCIEPLGRHETDFVNTLDEAAAIVRRIDRPALRTMVDTLAARSTEKESLEALLERWLPSGLIAHVQLNDRNRRGPGQGEDRFLAALAILKRQGYRGWLAMEPFQYHPDGATSAARSIGYVQGLLEALR
jgi:sugar phosphate isomerase/epimerase